MKAKIQLKVGDTFMFRNIRGFLNDDEKKAKRREKIKYTVIEVYEHFVVCAYGAGQRIAISNVDLWLGMKQEVEDGERVDD